MPQALVENDGKAPRQNGQNNSDTSVEMSLSPDVFAFLEALAKKAAKIVSASVCYIHAVNPHQKPLLVTVWSMPTNPLDFDQSQDSVTLVQQVLVQGQIRFEQSHLIQNNVQAQSVLGVTVTTPQSEIPLGTLIVANQHNSQSFSAEDEQYLRTFVIDSGLGFALETLQFRQKQIQWSHELHAINYLGQALVDSQLHLDVKSVCYIAIYQAHFKNIIPFDFAEITLWNEETYILTTAFHWPETVAHPSQVYQLDEGYSGWLANHQQSLCIDDTHHLTEILPQGGLTEFPYRSYIGTPLKINARFIGTLELALMHPGVYTQKDVAVLEIIASHIAVAIQQAQVYQQQLEERALASHRIEKERQRRQLADTLRSVAEAVSSQLEFDDLLNIVLQGLGQVVEYDNVNIQLLQGDQLVIIGGRGWQEDSQKVIGLTFPMSGNNPNRLVVEMQEPVIVKDVHAEYSTSFEGAIHKAIKSWLGVPLTYGTNILGLMALGKGEEDFYTSDDAEVVLAFANQVAIALQNARLFEDARNQVRQLAALTEVAQSLNQVMDLNEILDLVLDAVFDLVGHTKGSIWLIDRETETVKIADTRNVTQFLFDLFNESNISVDTEPFSSVIQSGETLIIAGKTEEDEIANYGLPFPDDVTYVPLKTESGVIGILAIEVVIHNKNMLQLVTILGNLAAVAIESGRLLSDTRRRATEMQQLYNLGVDLSGMLDVQQVMRSVVNNALTLTASQVGAIVFWDEEPQRYLIEGLTTDEAQMEVFTLNQAVWAENTPFSQNLASLWGALSDQIVANRKPILADLSGKSQQISIKAKKLALPHDKMSHSRAFAQQVGLRAILGVPIQIQNQINGAIFVGTLTPFDFNQHDLQSLSFVANQASVAVRNAQLVQRLNMLTEELEQRVALRTEELAMTLQDLTDERDRVSTLYQIARELSSSFDLDRILDEALHLLNRAIGVYQGAILLVDPKTEYLIFRAALGRDVMLPRGGLQTNYKVGEGLAGSVMKSRQARLVSDLSLDENWVVSKVDDSRRSAIAVPLSTGDEAVGVLLLFHDELGYFTESHLQLVSAASAQIATTVNNAELYRLITDQAERMGVMYRTQASEAAKNQAILEGITDGVLVLNTKCDIILINPKAAEILNINAQALENKPLDEILGYAESEVEAALAQSLYDRVTASLHAIEAGEDSAEFRIEAGPKALMVSMAPVALSADMSRSIVAVLRDISREAEIERIKNEFVSTVSHELRTPMTSIKGYADLLLSGKEPIGELTPIQHRFVKVIQSNADRLTELVNDILEISRIETGRIKLNFAALDLIEIIKDVAVSFEGQMVKKKMNLSLNLPDQLPNVYADKARLTQIVVNLIGNAWQYTPEGRNINVSAQIVGDFVQVGIEDNGIGIIEKDVEYVFDRFFRSERTEVQVVDGTGLGLSITKSFVDMLGGQIWVKSELDVGSKFSFTVPLAVNTTETESDNQLGLHHETH